MKRQPRPEPPAWALPWISSFELSLRAAGRAGNTIKMYADNSRWFAGWLAAEHPDVDDWSQVGVTLLRLFFVHLRDDRECTESSRNAIGRSIQAFMKWYSAEEDVPNPFDKIKPPPAPKVGKKKVPVLAAEQLTAIVKDAEKGRDFESRRDAAILRLFSATGGRVSELALLIMDDINLAAREATVVGKGDKVRMVKFDHACALALDRYLRVRAKHKHAQLPALWLGARRKTGMTAWGVRQVITRRGERLGIKLWPHLFRHTFAHRWLDNGGAEGDLDELMGWESPQMRALYGRSARSARARRHYDQVMGNG